jgi:hypothetical protein
VVAVIPPLSRFSALAQRQGKTVRLATKSVRVPDLIKRALEVGAPTFRGLMCFSAAEARYWGVDAGLDDLMIAYPSAVHDLGDVWVLAVDHNKAVQVRLAPMVFPFQWGRSPKPPATPRSWWTALPILRSWTPFGLRNKQHRAAPPYRASRHVRAYIDRSAAAC